MDILWRQEFIDYSPIKFIESKLNMINESMMQKKQVIVKWDIDYSEWKIKSIKITDVIPSQIFENIDQ